MAWKTNRRTGGRFFVRARRSSNYKRYTYNGRSYANRRLTGYRNVQTGYGGTRREPVYSYS